MGMLQVAQKDSSTIPASVKTEYGEIGYKSTMREFFLTLHYCHH